MSATFSATNQTDIREKALAVLKAVEQSGEQYGAAYIVQVLKGFEQSLRKREHAQIESFSAMRRESKDFIHNLIRYLVRIHLLEIKDERFGNLGITEPGRAFISQPGPLRVKTAVLKTGKYDRMLLASLRQLRLQISRAEKKPPFTVFTDHTLYSLVEIKPHDVKSLKEIPGLSDYKADHYGPGILATILRIKDMEHWETLQKQRQRAASPGHQAVKALFEAGGTVAEIAKKRGVRQETVINTLITLHRAGEIDLKPWVVERVRKKDLEKAGSFFQNRPDKGLREAYELLGLDYETLKLSKLYISELKRSEDEFRFAS